MQTKHGLPPEDQAEAAKQPATDPLLPQEPAPVITPLSATVIAPKALLRDIKVKNKAGRPVMRIHEPRLRFETGAVLMVFPDEIVADGGVIYLLCADHPDRYVRKIDVAIRERE